ncbi:hypothetical protein [Streptomyces sp. NPDC048172]|uniref:hypothetical protein n=1 Tax=Streptomyces sp. NPDC048172 TaxID=3365505 RepID=UPI003712C900
MSVTLGELLKAAADEVREAVRHLPSAPTGAHAHILRHLVAQLRLYPTEYARDPGALPGPAGLVRTAMSPALSRLHHELGSAERRLDTLPFEHPSEATDPAAQHLAAAGQLLTASRDVLRSHRGPGGRPLTPYAVLLAEPGVQRYVCSRLGDVAREAARYADTLARRSPITPERARFADVRNELDRATLTGHSALLASDRHFGTLPLAAPPGAEDRGDLLDGTDRLTRHIFRVSQGADALSSSDLQQISRYLYQGHLLAGRVLRHLATEQDTGPAADLQLAADKLRTSAMAWQRAAKSWHRVVDLGDPREHPPLDRTQRTAIREGRMPALPRTRPHPATLEARALVLQVGQLLYGPSWSPEYGVRQKPRPVSEIIRNGGGPGRLWTALHGIATASRHLATAIPGCISRLANRLASDDPDFIPRNRTTKKLRWRPLTAAHRDRLAKTQAPTERASEAAAAHLVTAARATGTDIPRAHLEELLRTRQIPAPPSSRAADRLDALLKEYRAYARPKATYADPVFPPPPSPAL